MSYKSPIDIVVGKFNTQIENNVFKAVQDYGISVDKDELIKALKYDRDQYEHGFKDGYWAGKNEIVRCKDCTEWNETEGECSHWYGFRENDYCSHGERREQKVTAESAIKAFHEAAHEFKDAPPDAFIGLQIGRTMDM